MCSHSVGSGNGEPDAITNAIKYAKFYSRSHDAAIRVYDQAGNVIETHEQETNRTDAGQSTSVNNF
jgi:hypothetical protein